MLDSLFDVIIALWCNVTLIIGVGLGITGMIGAMKGWPVAGGFKLSGTIMLFCSTAFTAYALGFYAFSVLLVIALFLAICGDLFLSVISIPEVFIFGMISFMLAYLILGVSILFSFNVEYILKDHLFASLFIVLTFIVSFVGVIIYSMLDKVGSNAIPVIAYLVVQTFLVATAILSQNGWIIAGAILLYLSDLAIAFNLFSTKINFGNYYQLVIMPTYYIGLALVVKGVMKV